MLIPQAVVEVGGSIGGTGTLLLMPGAATLPDGSSGNAAPGMVRFQGTEANPKKHFLALSYDGAGTTIEYAWWDFVMPDDYSSGGDINLYWMLNATTGTVQWGASVGAITADDADTPLEHANAVASTINANVNTTEARRLTVSTITPSVDGAVSGDWMVLTIYRDPANDTATQDAELIGATFRYTRG